MQTTLPLGSIVRERYIVEGLLGQGGFGAVYLVRDRHVQSNVYALKEVIEPNKKEREHFTFEGEILQRLNHPALPHVYGTFDDAKNARAYMLLDYIEGPNLEILRKQQLEKRFSLPQTLRIMAPIFAVVGYLHKQHPPIVHRDIKPANIIVPTRGDRSVLVDFGIAKEYEQEGTTTAIRRCSPRYGAPEQYESGTNPRTDIYGLGATFYALVTGQAPVDALYRITQLGRRQADPLLTGLVPEMPQYLADAIKRAMAIYSNDRFASAEEFWQALNARPIENEAPPALVMAPAPIAELYQTKDSATPDISDDPTAVKGLQKYKLPHFDSGIHNRTSLSGIINKAEVPNSRQKKPHSQRKRGALILLCIVIALFASLAGVTLGSVANPSHKVAKIIPSPSQKVGATTPTATSSAQPTVKSTPAPTPTSVISQYPQLVNSYQGSITDKFTQPSTSSNMSLSQIKQNKTNVTGYFAVGPGLIGNGNFTGIVSTDNKIQFTIPSYGGLLPLLFQGQIRADGSITGDYCSYQNNQCDYSSGGYGDWSIAPSSH